MFFKSPKKKEDFKKVLKKFQDMFLIFLNVV